MDWIDWLFIGLFIFVTTFYYTVFSYISNKMHHPYLKMRGIVRGITLAVFVGGLTHLSSNYIHLSFLDMLVIMFAIAYASYLSALHNSQRKG